MKLRNAVLAIAIGAATLATTPASVLAQGPGGWEQPPSEYRELQQQGYRDGIEGARKDFQNHRKPDVNNRDEYKHPKVPGPDKEAYREAFRSGYEAGVQHIWNGVR
jgi:ribosome modulation factor